MGIQSTKTITREEAINRVAFIAFNVYRANWHPVLVEASANEEDGFDVVDGYNYFLDEYHDILKRSRLRIDPDATEDELKVVLEKVTNKTLENFMDYPGVRFSLFDNYFVE